MIINTLRALRSLCEKTLRTIDKFNLKNKKIRLFKTSRYLDFDSTKTRESGFEIANI